MSYNCHGCDSYDLSDDQIFICISCDKAFCNHCYQTTGRYLTPEEDELYDEDEPNWWCKECVAIE